MGGRAFSLRFATIDRRFQVMVHVRFLFLLLLLANLLFLAWVRWVSPGLVEAARPAAATVAQPRHPIRLQQEVAGEARGTASGTAAGKGDSLAAATCVAVGPYASREHALAAGAALARLGFRAELRSSTDEVRVGTWVRVPDFATPDDAANALVALRAAGLVDAQVVADEGPGNIVSVGVYADPIRAEAAVRAVAGAGFTAEARDRRRTLEVHWLDIDRRANGSVPTPDELAGLPEGGLPLELRACPGAGGTG